MKKYIFIIIALLTCQAINAQTNPIDELFNKYSEKKGYTSVYISGKMLGMLAGMEEKTGNEDNIMTRLKSIRILSEDDSLSGGNVNFYDELSKKVDFSEYEELMVVKEDREITKFLIRQSGKSVSELLVITGGKNGNALISIRGDLNLRELSKISETVGIEELKPLNNVQDIKPPQ